MSGHRGKQNRDGIQAVEAAMEDLLPEAFYFVLFIYFFAVKEEVMLFADKRENVMGGFPKRVQSSPLSMVSLSMVLVTCSQAQSENIKWKIPETSHSKV